MLSNKYNATIKAYSLRRPKWWKSILNIVNEKVFKSFNTREIICLKLSEEQKKVRHRLFNDVYTGLETKRDVEGLRIVGTLIGDLVYDSHLRKNNVPTIDIADHKFKESLKQSLGIYVFWSDYFATHEVKAVNVSHCVYNSAIILRLAIQKKIPVYQISATHAYYLTEENLWAYDDFYYYPEEFRKLPPKKQQAGLVEAQKRLQKRFSGEVGVDMTYSRKSAYTKTVGKKVLRESSRTKIIISTHCFFDSPHPYGISLFPDFYEWLTFIGNISEKTDYDWYIKTHPDFLPGNIPIIKEFIKKFPKLNLIPAETSHHQIIKEGIDFALTVHGTIGFEYAALGVTVINASRCNPHIAYNFNIHPKSVEEYEKILLDLPNQKLNINVNEVYEYYYMKFINNNVENWIFDDYEDFINEIGGYDRQFGPVSYKKFLEEFSVEKHEKIIHSLNNFIESKNYCMQKKHYDKALQKN
ncbi:MAG: hypothetical protein SWH54_18785 [Thermodesulfobacteriota bacterium]|nr:hypothetical protein [Thermodesulfobacteriota bacterium]